MATTEEFAAKIRAKFPGKFDQMNDIELSRQIVADVPQLKTKVDFREELASEAPTQEIQDIKSKFGADISDEQVGQLQAQAKQEQAGVIKQPLPFQQKTEEFFKSGGQLIKPFEQKKTSVVPYRQTMAFRDEAKKDFDNWYKEEFEPSPGQIIKTPLNLGLLNGKSSKKYQEIISGLEEKYKDEKAAVKDDGTLLYALKGVANVPINLANLPSETVSFVSNIKENFQAIGDVINEYQTNPEFKQQIHDNFPEMLDKAVYENPLDFIELGMGGVFAGGKLAKAATKLPGAVAQVPRLAGKIGQEAVRAGETVAPLAQQAGRRISEGLAAVPEKISELKPTRKPTITTEEQVAKAAGAITQSPEEVKNLAAARTFDRLNLKSKEVSSYKNLRNDLNTFTKDVAKQQDDLLGQSEELFTLDRLKKVGKVGDETIESTPFVSALDDLEEVYTKLNQPEDAARIKQLRQKAETEGITLNEQNKIAREYGAQESGFSDRTGNPLTSTNAKGRENARKALKEIMRKNADSVGIKGSADIDSVYSDAATTKRLMERMETSVNKLSNKVENLTWLQQGARKLGKLFDVATLGMPKQAFSAALLRGNVGFKTLNSLQIQENLNKNIKILEKLFKQLDETKKIGQQKKVVNDAIKESEEISKGVTIEGGTGRPTNVRESRLFNEADVDIDTKTQKPVSK